MADWYYAKAGKQFGPITPAQLRQMAQSGELVPDDLVFQEGGTQWVSASTVKGLFSGSTGVAPPRSKVNSRGEIDRGTDERPSYNDPGAAEPIVERSAAPPGKRSYWVELILFRRLIAPTIIMILFWIGVAGVLLSSLVGVIGGLITMVNSNALQGLLMVFLGILYVPFGVLVVRLWCEMTILFFRMNETLTDIKDTLERNQRKD